MMNRVAVFASKAAAVWLASLLSSVVAAIMVGMGDEGVGSDGPLSGENAFLLVNGIHAVILSAIASRSILRGWRLGILIWMTLFFAQSFLLMMEAAYFRDSLRISTALLVEGSLHVLLTGALIGAAVSVLWRRPITHIAVATNSNELPKRLAMVSVLYVVCYLIAGYFIAWQASEVREYYGFGQDIAMLPLLAFQLLRGALWGVLAYILSANLRGGRNVRAIIVGAAFSVLAVAQLLYPSTIMPWEVRLPHLIEVGISNFLFGACATRILLSGQPSEEEAIQDDPIRGPAPVV